MATGSPQFVLRFKADVRPKVVAFAERIYGDRKAFDDHGLLDYHKKLAAHTAATVATYFNSLDSLTMSADAGNRLNTICEAAWLLSAISCCGETIDDVFTASDDRVAGLVASCTPDCRLFAPRRVDLLIGQVPDLTIDAKLLIFADMCLTVELRKPMDKYIKGDIQRMLLALNSLAAFPALGALRAKALTELGVPLK